MNRSCNLIASKTLFYQILGSPAFVSTTCGTPMGYLKLSLVSAPIAIYPATSSSEKVSTGLAAKRATAKHRRSDPGGRYLRCYRQLQGDYDPRQLDLFREQFPLAAARRRN